MYILHNQSMDPAVELPSRVLELLFEALGNPQKKVLFLAARPRGGGRGALVAGQ